MSEYYISSSQVYTCIKSGLSVSETCLETTDFIKILTQNCPSTT